MLKDCMPFDQWDLDPIFVYEPVIAFSMEKVKFYSNDPYYTWDGFRQPLDIYILSILAKKVPERVNLSRGPS